LSDTTNPADLNFHFLQDEHDLICLNDNTCNYGSSIMDPVSVVPLIIPLLLFKACTNVINRLLIVAVTLALVLWLANSGYMASSTRQGHFGTTNRALLFSAGISVCVGLLY
jgi:hypothetical protein